MQDKRSAAGPPAGGRARRDAINAAAHRLVSSANRNNEEIAVNRFQSRRALVAAVCASPFVALSATSDGKRPWVLGQSSVFTGPMGEIGKALGQGAACCFAQVNARGGVHGRPIQLNTVDDAYDVKRAAATMKGFIDDPSVFALFSCMGTPTVAAALPDIIESRMPFFAPFTGTTAVRLAGVRNIFCVRPSYPEEAAHLVQHLATVGRKRISLAYQNNSFGKEVLQGAQAAMRRYELQPTGLATVQDDTSDAEAAAAKIINAQPEALVLGLAGAGAIKLIKAVRAKRPQLPLYVLSVMGVAAVIKALGDDAGGIAIAQVVPSPGSRTIGVVRDFRDAWIASRTSLEPSHIALEGYINALAFVEALKKAGPGATRKSFVDAGWGRTYDLGGFPVAFMEPGTSGSRFLDLALIGRNGKFLS
ncbi:MAG: ABC transporter substrate-binding protein [Rubrivivax sp.]|nr:ABC transporter substrate-binding protein [Rubrivivax sp.]